MRNTLEDPDNYWFARHSKSILLLILMLTIVGIYLALSIPVAVFPTTNFPRIIIGVDNGVTPIQQMEVTITRPIEQAVNSVPGLVDVRSTTSRGSAEIDLTFDWNVDMLTTLQQVDSAVSRVQSSLPPTAQIQTHRVDFASFPIIGYSLTSDNVAQTDLWEIATYDIKPRLNRLNGVAGVIVQGGQVPEFHITVDPANMLRAKVGIPDILTAVNKTNVIDSPGLMSRDHQLFLGLLTSQVNGSDGINAIVVKNANNTPVRIQDIGSVSSSTAPNYTAVSANGKPAVLLSISRQPNSNTVQVANEVTREMEAIRPSLPYGVQMLPFYDQSNIVQQSIASVRDAIIIGLIFAGIIIWLFLRDWGSMMTALVVPVTIVVTFIAIKMLHQSFNLMTLGGLAAAVGLVIDDAIVVVENIVMHRDAGEGRLEAIESALREITVPLIGSTITPVVVFIPLIAITGVTGVFFRALAVTMSVSLLTSLALAVTWTPNLSQYFIRGKHDKGDHESDFNAPGTHPAMGTPNGPAVAPEEQTEADNLQRLLAAEEKHLSGFFLKVVNFHERWLRRALERPRFLVLFSLVLVGVSYVCYHFSGSDLLPAMDEGGFVIDYIMPAGSSLAETNRVVGHVEQILRQTPEVEGTSRRTGLQLGMASVTEANTGDVSVKLKADRSRGIDEVIEEVRSKVKAEEPALDVEFIQILQDMIGDLTSAPQPVQIKLFAQDQALLADWAPKVADSLSKVKGVVDVLNGIDNTISGPAVTFQINPGVAARAG